MAAVREFLRETLLLLSDDVGVAPGRTAATTTTPTTAEAAEATSEASTGTSSSSSSSSRHYQSTSDSSPSGSSPSDRKRGMFVYEKLAARADYRFAVFLYHGSRGDNDCNNNNLYDGNGSLYGESSSSPPVLSSPAATITCALAMQVGGRAVADACAGCEEGRRRSGVITGVGGDGNDGGWGRKSGNQVSSPPPPPAVSQPPPHPPSLFLTPTRPPLALLMANLAGVTTGSVVLDPFCGSGALLWGAAHAGAALCLGSDLVVPKAASETLRPPSRTAVEFLRCDVFALPHGRGGGCGYTDGSPPSPFPPASLPLLDAIVTDPPYGLREGQTGWGQRRPPSPGRRQPGPGSSNSNNSCFIEDYSGRELLESVSAMMRPVFRLASERLRPGGRLVFLLPVFPCQADMGLWWDGGEDNNNNGDVGGRRRHRGDGPGTIPDDTVRRYLAPAWMPPNGPWPDLRIVSAERHRCTKRSLARAVVVVEKARAEGGGTCS